MEELKQKVLDEPVEALLLAGSAVLLLGTVVWAMLLVIF